MECRRVVGSPHLPNNQPLGLALFFTLKKRNGLSGFDERKSLIADTGKGQPLESGDLCGETGEDVLNAVQAVGTAQCNDEIADDLPGVVGVAGAFDCFVEALETTCDVDHAATLLCIRTACQHDMGKFGRSVGKDVQADEGAQTFQVSTLKARLQKVLAKGDDGLDRTTFYTCLNLGKL